MCINVSPVKYSDSEYFFLSFFLNTHVQISFVSLYVTYSIKDYFLMMLNISTMCIELIWTKLLNEEENQSFQSDEVDEDMRCVKELNFPHRQEH